MQEYQNYLNNYNGIGKAYRALQFALEPSQKNERPQLLSVAMRVAREQNLVGYYDIILREGKVQVQDSDVAWYTEQKQKLDQQAQQKTQEITQYKSQKNNQSTRISMIELARLYLQAGNVLEAARNFDKANTYRQQNDSIIEFIDEYSLALFFNKDYEKLTILQAETAGVAPQQIELKEKLQVSYLCQLLRCLNQQEYSDFMEISKNRIQPDDFPDNINNLTSVQDLGNYITLIGFYKNRKLRNAKEFTHFHVLYNNENAAPLIVGSPNALKAADNYVQMQFSQALNHIRIVATQELLYDPFLQGKNHYLTSIERQFLVNYLKPFNKIKFDKICEEFGVQKEPLVKQLETMIREQKNLGEEQQVNFLIDPIEEILVQKITQETQKARVYSKSVKTAQKYLHDKQKNLIHYRMQQLLRDGKDSMMMDEFGGDEMIERAMLGQY